MSVDPTLSVPPDPSSTVTSADGTAAPAPFTGRQFGDYELLEEIARGGMGIVYKARQISLNRIVALKMILSGKLASTADILRFRQEAETAANLDHPHVMPIYEVGQHDGHPYFSMKLAHGGPLSGRIAEFVREPRAAAKLMEQIARGVHYAHQFGLLHRDIKPANILLDADRTPLITDFGLAKNIKGDSGLTQSGAILGTPSYMAPEQARGEKKITTAADVYSLGAILYELIAGRPPFRGETVAQTIRMVEESEPGSARSVNNAADLELEAIALKGLEKDPSRRYPSAGAMADDLAAWLRGEPVTARRAGYVRRAKKWVQRNPAVAGLCAVVAFLLLLTSISNAISAVRAKHREEGAKRSEQEARTQEATAKDREEVLKDTLCVATFERARAERLAGRPGWRARSLELLRAAAELRLRDRNPDDKRVELPAVADIRSEVVNALIAEDANEVREIPLGFSSAPAVSTNGGHVVQLSLVPFASMDSTLRIIDLQTGKDDQSVKFKYDPANPNEEMTLMHCLSVDEGARRALCLPLTFVGPVAVRELPSGKRICDLTDNTKKMDSSRIERARFSLDGKKVAAVRRTDEDKKTGCELLVWDVARPDSPHVFDRRPPLPMSRFAFGMNGDVDEYIGIRFSPDSKQLCYCSADKKSLHVRDLTVHPPGQLPDVPVGAEVLTVEWHPTMPILAILSAGEAGQQPSVALWDLKNGAEIKRQRMDVTLTDDKAFASLAFSPDGRWLAVGGGQTATVQVLGAVDLSERFQVRDSAIVGIYRVFWTPGGELAVAAVMEGIRIYRPDELSLSSMSSAFAPAGRPVFSPDGKRLAVLAPSKGRQQSSLLTELAGDGGARGEALDRIALIDRKTGRVERFLPGPKRADARLHFSPDGRRLAVERQDSLVVYNADDGAEVLRRPAPSTSGITHWHDTFYLPDGRLASITALTKPRKAEDKEPDSVVLWDVVEGKVIQTLDVKVGAGWGVNVVLSPAGDRALIHRSGFAFAFDKSERPKSDMLFELPSCRRIAEVSRPNRSEAEVDEIAVLNRQGNRTLSMHMNFLGPAASIRNALWAIRALPSGEELLSIPNRSLVDHGNDFSPDGRLVALSAHKGEVEVWDTDARRLLFRWQPHGTKIVDHLSFSPEGDIATIARNDDRLIILRMKEVRERLTAMGLGW